MMKSVSIIIVFLLIISAGISQTWPKLYGEPGRYDESRDIIETYDRGFLILGNYASGVAERTWFIKIAINGNVLWEKTLENAGSNYCNSIEPTLDGGFLVCGVMKVSLVENSDPFIAKFNSCGEKLWCKILDGDFDLPYAKDVKELPNGDIIVLVNQFGDEFIPGMYLFKLDSDGSVIWKDQYVKPDEHPESSTPLGRKLLITEEQNAIIVGTVYWENPWGPSGVASLRPMFVLINEDGTEEWVLPYGLNDTLTGGASDLMYLGNGEYLGGGFYYPGPDPLELLYMKFNNYGEELEYTTIHPTHFDTSFFDTTVEDFYFLNDSMIVSGGQCRKYNISEPVRVYEAVYSSNIFEGPPTVYAVRYHEEQWPRYKLILTSNHKLVNDARQKISQNNWDISISKMSFALEYDSLNSNSYTYDSLCPYSIQTETIYMDDCDIILSTDEIPTPEEYFASLNTIPVKAFPNPSNTGSITLQYSNTDHHSNMEIRCFNIHGKEVKFERIYQHQAESLIDVREWPKGMYLAIMYSDNKLVGQTKFIVR